MTSRSVARDANRTLSDSGVMVMSSARSRCCSRWSRVRHLAYSVQQRVRDFRRATGRWASTGDVLRLVATSAARVIAAGAVIGLVLAAALGRSSARSCSACSHSMSGDLRGCHLVSPSRAASIAAPPACGSASIRQPRCAASDRRRSTVARRFRAEAGASLRAFTTLQRIGRGIVGRMRADKLG